MRPFKLLSPVAGAAQNYCAKRGERYQMLLCAQNHRVLHCRRKSILFSLGCPATPAFSVSWRIILYRSSVLLLLFLFEYSEHHKRINSNEKNEEQKTVYNCKRTVVFIILDIMYAALSSSLLNCFLEHYK